MKYTQKTLYDTTGTTLNHLYRTAEFMECFIRGHPERAAEYGITEQDLKSLWGITGKITALYDNNLAGKVDL